MMKRLALLMAAGTLFLMMPAVGADLRVRPAYAGNGAPLLILADVSGSMRETMTVPAAEDTDDEDLPKIVATKRLLLEILADPALDSRDLGIYRLCHQSGNPLLYQSFLDIGPHGREDVADWIEDEFAVDYPVFNRRTPLADALRQIDEDILAGMEVPPDILILSDGKESFYRPGKDRAETVNPDSDEIVGPITEIRRLTARYGDRMAIHTVFLGDADSPMADDRVAALSAYFKKETDEVDGRINGQAVLAAAAGFGGGERFSGADLLASPERLDAARARIVQRIDD